MEKLLLSPPITLSIFILLGLLLSRAVAAYAAVGEQNERKLEAYACGQRQVTHNVSPDYSQFFPYAFFFTIMHVLVLVVATAPPGALILPLLYVAGGLLALIIIFRR
jgi:NADH-quinone oxidoreductase subunit A